MKWRIVIQPQAYDDLISAIDWYNAKQDRLGEEIESEFDAAIERLLDNPKRNPFYYRNHRRVLLRRFEYKLFYELRDERIIIHRFLHAKRDHRKELRRKK